MSFGDLITHDLCVNKNLVLFFFVCMYNVSVLICVTSFKQNSYFLFVLCEKSCLCVLLFGLVLGFVFCLFVVVVFEDLFGGNEDPNATFLAEISCCKLASEFIPLGFIAVERIMEWRRLQIAGGGGHCSQVAAL